MHIREMRPGDEPEVARLATELGYFSTEEDVRRRFKQIERLGDQKIFVSEAAAGQLPEKLLGWIHLTVHHSLCTDARVEVAGLIVDEKCRGQGFGAQLIAHAEKWAQSILIPRMRLSSNIIRSEAHRFYARLGYETKKTSHVFSKNL